MRSPWAPQGAISFSRRVIRCSSPWSQPTNAAADLRLDVADLGSLLLGGVSARDLFRVGRVEELHDGAVARADAFFGWPSAPFCTTRF